MSSPRVAVLLSLLLASAAPGAEAPPLGQAVLPELTLQGTSGGAFPLRETARKARFTVLVFFSATCPCLEAHDQRLVALARAQAPGEVQVLAVDSESGASLEQDRAEAQRRGYPFPILLDPGGQLARAVGAVFATTTVVVDAEGRLRFRGGIDSAKREFRPDARPWLKYALEALLRGQAPDPAEPKTLGCFLRLG